MQAVRSEGRVKELFRKYGKVAVATHLAVYAVTFSGKSSKGKLCWALTLQSLVYILSVANAGLYVAIENKFDPKDQLIKYGLLSSMLKSSSVT